MATSAVKEFQAAGVTHYSKEQLVGKLEKGDLAFVSCIEIHTPKKLSEQQINDLIASGVIWAKNMEVERQLTSPAYIKALCDSYDYLEQKISIVVEVCIRGGAVRVSYPVKDEDNWDAMG